MGLVVFGDSLYVSTMGRTHVFSKSGDAVRSFASVFYPRLFNIGGHLYAARTKKGGVFAEIDAGGGERTVFGPDTEDWWLHWVLLEGPKGALTAVELHDGYTLLIDADKTIKGTLDLGLGRGWQHEMKGKDVLSDSLFCHTWEYFTSTGPWPFELNVRW